MGGPESASGPIYEDDSVCRDVTAMAMLAHRTDDSRSAVDGNQSRYAKNDMRTRGQTKKCSMRGLNRTEQRGTTTGSHLDDTVEPAEAVLEIARICILGGGLCAELCVIIPETGASPSGMHFHNVEPALSYGKGKCVPCGKRDEHNLTRQAIN